MNEITTLLTDYLLGAVSLVLALKLARRPTSLPQKGWVIAILLTALTALIGGTYHGFHPLLTPFAGSLLWKATLFTAVGFSCAMTLSILILSIRPSGFRILLISLVAIKASGFLIALARKPDFGVVILDYGSSMTLIAGLALWQWTRHQAVWGKWILGGICISLLAAAAQRLTFHGPLGFNHNDVFHLIQIPAMICFYQAGRKFECPTPSSCANR